MAGDVTGFWWWFMCALSIAAIIAGIGLIAWVTTAKWPCPCGCHAVFVYHRRRLIGWIAGGLIICVGFAGVGVTFGHAVHVCSANRTEQNGGC